jgi:TfoX/Sxy family transcriptional regulator of competence genes
MFGGHGIYHKRTMFAIVYRERLYFKVNKKTDPDYFYCSISVDVF